MITPKLVSGRELQQNYKKVIEKAKTSHEPVIIVSNNKPQAAVISMEYLEELEAAKETADILSNTEEAEAIRKGLAQINNRETVSFIPLKD